MEVWESIVSVEFDDFDDFDDYFFDDDEFQGLDLKLKKWYHKVSQREKEKNYG